PSNEFVTSDVVPEYGHEVVDATRMSFVEEFDVVLCTCVLEHVYDVGRAVENIRCALKPGGTALLLVPCVYPLHDEPHDYWRFTEHSLRILLKDFPRIPIRRAGPRHIRVQYSVAAL